MPMNSIKGFSKVLIESSLRSTKNQPAMARMGQSASELRSVVKSHFKRGEVDAGIKLYYQFRKQLLVQRFADRMSGQELKKYVENYFPRYSHFDFVIKWPVKYAMRLVKKRIDQIQSGLKEPKVKTKKKNELRAELNRLKGAIALADSIPEGKFHFADARKVASKAKAQILIGVLNNNPRLFQRGMHTAKLLKTAKTYSDGAKRVVKPYLELFPQTLREAVQHGTKGFPILSDDYDGHQLEWGPRPKIIEKLPVVEAFKAFKKSNKKQAASLVADLNHAVRSNMGLLKDAGAFEKGFNKWKKRFDAISWPTLEAFFNKMKDIQVESQPPVQTHVGALLFLDGVIATLGKPTQWNQKKLDELAVELIKFDRIHKRITKGNKLIVDMDNPQELDVIQSMYPYNDPIIGLIGENNGFSLRDIRNTRENLKYYAEQLREKVTKELSKELGDAIDKISRIRGMDYGQVRKMQELKKEIISGGLEGKERGDAIVRLFFKMQLEQNKVMTNSMISALKVYRQKDKAMMTCSWDDLDALVWVWCRGANLIGGWDLNYNDKTFTPFIEDLERIKGMLNNPAQVDEGMDEFAKVWNSKFWPKIKAEGEDALSAYKWSHIASNIVIIVASAIAGQWVGTLARLGTLGRLGKGIHDAAKLARIARIVESATFAITFTQMEMGLTSNTWLGYNFKKDRWEVPRTIEKTLVNAAMFGMGKWMLKKYLRSVEKFANARRINLAEIGWKGSTLVKAGSYGAIYTGFTLFDGIHGIYEAGKKEGFAKVFTSSGKMLHEFKKGMIGERGEKLVYRAAFLAAVSFGQFVGGIFADPVNKRIAKYAMGKYEQVFKNIQKSLNEASEGFSKAATAKEAESFMKTIEALEEVLVGYAAVMKDAGMRGTENYSKVWLQIQKVRTLHDLFSAECRIAGLRRVDGDYTYQASKKQALIDALESVKAKARVFEDGKIIATIDGTAHIFTPRKPVRLSDGPGKIAVETWKNLTPAQKTAVWYFGFPLVFNAALAFPKIFGAAGLLGLSHYTISRTTRPKK